MMDFEKGRGVYLNLVNCFFKQLLSQDDFDGIDEVEEEIWCMCFIEVFFKMIVNDVKSFDVGLL